MFFRDLLVKLGRLECLVREEREESLDHVVWLDHLA